MICDIYVVRDDFANYSIDLFQIEMTNYILFLKWIVHLKLELIVESKCEYSRLQKL